MTMFKALHSRDDRDWLYVSKKKKKKKKEWTRELTCIQDCFDALVQGHEDLV